ncbi:hypothetical protein AB4Z29_05220 [Paenibacillus sp. 2TAB23]|uniref:hypothetical protein n=1 Tax=Paenibacillus sp. 2TAB23 TaxID=3233004 RepID=UPI003F9902E2
MKYIWIKNIEFTKEEIEEIEIAKDLCEGMEVDGNKVVCFDILSQIFRVEPMTNDKTEEYLKAYSQLIQYNKFWSHAEWFDNVHIESVTVKLKKLLKQMKE